RGAVQTAAAIEARRGYSTSFPSDLRIFGSSTEAVGTVQRDIESYAPRPVIIAPQMNTRRQFLITAHMGALAAVAACRAKQQPPPPPPTPPTAGAPPTFGTGPVSGPPVSSATFAEAEKLVQLTMSA